MQKKNFINKPKVDISIVCASHKGLKKIPKLLDSIYANTYHPYEILICVTDIADTLDISDFIKKNLNIKVIISNEFNQIKQRTNAINRSKSNYILQLDDDLILDSYAIENYWINIKSSLKPKKLVIGGYVTLPNKKHQSYRWYQHYNNNIFFRKILYLLNKFNLIKPMTVVESGRIIPLTNELPKNTRLKCQWLNSSILYHKDVDRLNYDIKFKNKAYFEDVFFSYNLYKLNYTLILDSSIILYHPFIEQTNLNVYLDSVFYQFKFNLFYKLSKFLFLLDFLLFTTYYILKRFFVILKIK